MYQSGSIEVDPEGFTIALRLPNDRRGIYCDDRLLNYILYFIVYGECVMYKVHIKLFYVTFEIFSDARHLV